MADRVSPVVTHSVALLALVSCSLTATARGAWAAEPPAGEPYHSQGQLGPQPDSDAWRFTAASYGWVMSVTGSTTVRGQTVDSNASFIELVQKSDSLIGFMGYFEADKGRVGFYTDLVFTRLGFAASDLNYRNPVPGLRLTLTTQKAATLQMFIAEMGGVYELERWRHSQGSFTALDALGGFRYWNMSVDASFDAQANVNVAPLHLDRNFGLAVARQDGIQWVDPILGLRLRHQFTPNQQIWVRGDVGGFELANSFTWQAVGAYSYAWHFTGYEIAALIGFRALGVNYHTTATGPDAFGMNQIFYGPIIGMSFHW